MIRIKKDAKVYIICPANYATGGPEALHQLGYYLRKSNTNAFMFYVWMDKKAPNNESPVHPNYHCYDVPYLHTIENHPNNILITPETFLDPIFEWDLDQTQKIIWWLSVSNYYRILSPKKKKYYRNPLFWLRKLINPKRLGTLSELKKSKTLHLAHSYYSKVHIEQNHLPLIGQISDFMNAAFINAKNKTKPRKHQVIYNPIKNDDFLDSIIAASPDVCWVPIKDMTPSEVAETMSESKVYVDFGYHPGKERMPREACIMRCCLIIGKEGSARYSQDMPIPEDYRFDKDDKNIASIISQIKSCLDNYDGHIARFEQYRKVLLLEEETFSKDVQKVFVLEE